MKRKPSLYLPILTAAFVAKVRANAVSQLGRVTALIPNRRHTVLSGLLLLASERGYRGLVTTLAQLGSLLDASRRTVCRDVRQLESQGWIQRESRYVRWENRRGGGYRRQAASEYLPSQKLIDAVTKTTRPRRRKCPASEQKPSHNSGALSIRNASPPRDAQSHSRSPAHPPKIPVPHPKTSK